MRIIAFIENEEVIKRILKHLDLWDVKPRPPPPMPKAQPLYTKPWIDYSESQDAPSDNGLGHCAWESLKAFLQIAVPEQAATPGAGIAIQTFGDFLNFNPHCHILCEAGRFLESGAFKVDTGISHGGDGKDRSAQSAQDPS